MSKGPFTLSARFYPVIFACFLLTCSINLSAQRGKTEAITQLDTIVALGKKGNFHQAALLSRKAASEAKSLGLDSLYAAFCFQAGRSYRLMYKQDSAYYFLKIADSVARNVGSTELHLGSIILAIELLHDLEQDLDSARQLLESIQPVMEKTTSLRLHSAYQYCLAAQSLLDHLPEEALTHYLKQIDYLQASGDTIGVSTAYGNVGLIFLNLGKNLKAIEYFKKAQGMWKNPSQHERRLAFTLINTGLAYYQLGHTDSAWFYYDKARVLGERYNNVRIEINAILGMSEIYLSGFTSNASNEFDIDAELQHAATLAEHHELNYEQVMIHLHLSSLARRKKNLADAEGHLRQAEKLVSKNAKDHLTHYQIMRAFVELYHDMGDHSSMYDHVTLAFAYRDSAYEESKLQNTAELEAKYQNQVAQKEIENLKTSQQLAEITHKQEQQLHWGIFAFCILIIGGFISVYYSRKKRQLAIKDKELEQLQHRIFETQQTALKAQINPHFIFNCMAAIDNYILNNEPLLASDLLTSFASLIRTILEQSEKEFIPLSQELKSLELYLQLEQVRFGNAFKYSIEAPDFDMEIPPLLLQPYVENANQHGVSGLQERQGEIKIKVATDDADNKVQIMIRDNGVGPHQSAAIRQHARPDHQSMGTRITQERMALLRRTRNIEMSVSTRDLATSGTSGTEVVITMERL